MGAVIVLMGLPGAGKSTYAATRARSDRMQVVTADAIRLERKLPAFVFPRMRHEVVDLLAAGRSVIVDACNVYAQHRRQWLRLGRQAGVRCELVVVDPGRDVAAARNAMRLVSVRVDSRSCVRMSREWSRAVQSARNEGWDRVVTVSSVDSQVSSRLW